MIFSYWNKSVSVRTQQHRLDASGKLFDMPADPGQAHDLSKEQPEVAARLSSAVEAWKRDVLAGFPPPDRPFTVGYREFPITQLPARWRAARQHPPQRPAPNCSFFENWTSPDDRIGRHDAVRREMAMSQKPAPAARVAPARAEPGHERVPDRRLHTQRRRVAFRAAVAVRKHCVKKHRREDDSPDEDRAENDEEEQAIGHSSPRYTRRVTLSSAARQRQRDSQLSFSNSFSILLQSSTCAIPFSIRSITTSAPAAMDAPSSPIAGTFRRAPSCS